MSSLKGLKKTLFSKFAQGYQKKTLLPGEKPVARFALAEGETVLSAYEYCNLHGLWKAEPNV